MTKKLYRIPCTWTVAGTMLVEAENLQDAIFEADNNAPLPEAADFIEGSFEVNHQVIPYVNKNLSKEEIESCGG